MYVIDLEAIREKERQSHIQMYSDSTLFDSEGWLKKPIKTVLELLPHLENRNNPRILDLGCGIGRNAIPIAKQLQNHGCQVDCVDILDLAIEKLRFYAKLHGVAAEINPILSPIESYPISENVYDLILCVSALEHVDCEAAFTKKLHEMETGVKKGGLVCCVINSQVTEADAVTGQPMPAQFEVNWETQALLELLNTFFHGWKQRKVTVRPQTYEIPRGDRQNVLHTNVLTFVAEKS